MNQGDWDIHYGVFLSVCRVHYRNVKLKTDQNVFGVLGSGVAALGLGGLRCAKMEFCIRSCGMDGEMGRI